MLAALPPTTPDLGRDDLRPYFLWWTDATTGDLRRYLRADDAEVRAYWTAALLREANSRDVWMFVTPDELRVQWPKLVRYLGRARAMWAYLLGLPAPTWPPREASGA